MAPYANPQRFSDMVPSHVMIQIWFMVESEIDTDLVITEMHIRYAKI